MYILWLVIKKANGTKLYQSCKSNSEYSGMRFTVKPIIYTIDT